MKDFCFYDVDTKSDEGKYFLAAMCILTTSDFRFKGNLVKGSSKSPNQIVEMLKTIVDELYYKED